MTLLQAHLHLALTKSPLEQDLLLIRGIKGEEALGRVSTSHLDLLSTDPEID
jgi:hypothetical protein